MVTRSSASPTVNFRRALMAFDDVHHRSTCSAADTGGMGMHPPPAFSEKSYCRVIVGQWEKCVNEDGDTKRRDNVFLYEGSNGRDTPIAARGLGSA